MGSARSATSPMPSAVATNPVRPSERLGWKRGNDEVIALVYLNVLGATTLLFVVTARGDLCVIQRRHQHHTADAVSDQCWRGIAADELSPRVLARGDRVHRFNRPGDHVAQLPEAD